MPSRPRTRRWQEVDKSDIRLDSAIQSYLVYHEDRNHSPKSVRWYADMLRRFAESLGPDARLGEIDADAVRKYMRSVRERGRSATRNSLGNWHPRIRPAVHLADSWASPPRPRSSRRTPTERWLTDSRRPRDTFLRLLAFGTRIPT